MNDEANLKRVESTRKAADTAAHNARNGFVTFILVSVYIAVIIGSTTDEQLLRGFGIILPLVNVELPIVGVYMFVPPLFVLLHFNLLLQLTFLSRSLHHLDREIDPLVSPKAQARLSPEEQARERDLIFPFGFSHLIVGHHHGAGMRGLIRFMAWTTMMYLPVLLLLWSQVQFLPYHSTAITWGAHRFSLVADLALLWFFWPPLFDPDSKWRPWRRDGSGHLTTVSGILWTLVAGWLSLFVLVVPGEVFELAAMRPVIAHVFGQRGYGNALGEGEWYEAWFHRNLVLPEKTLVAEPPAPEIVATYINDDRTIGEAFLNFGTGLDLRGRDLRFASFVKTNLAKADLRSARLQGANLKGARLQGANLRGARLQDAKLNSADLQGADLMLADLQGTVLEYANLQDAILVEARLQGANLSFAKLQFADMRDAQLQGVWLTSAKLQGAHLGGADLQGADLSFAELQGAALFKAKLQGADLSGAKLQGADLGDAELEGVDLRHASLGGAVFDDAKFRLADLRGANFEYLTSKEWDRLSDESGREAPSQSAVRQDNLREAARRRLERGSQSKKPFPDYEPEWHAMYDAAPEPGPDAQPYPLAHWPTPRLEERAFFVELGLFLADLACSDKFIAQGIVDQIILFGDSTEAGGRKGAPVLARFLLARANDVKGCPGLAALARNRLDSLVNVALSKN